MAHYAKKKIASFHIFRPRRGQNSSKSLFFFFGKWTFGGGDVIKGCPWGGKGCQV